MAVSFPLAVPTPSRAGIGGPKSAAGKARSAVNAVKHGLTSTNPVILDHETVEAWEAFRDAFVPDLRPVGTVEEELARDLALTQWRRRRHLERLQKTRRQHEAENCKTNSAPHLQVPVTSVPPVASVPSHPSAAVNCKTNAPAPLPSAEKYKTNSTPAAVPRLAQPAPSVAGDSARRPDTPTEPEQTAHPARTGPTMVPLAGYPRTGGGQLNDQQFRPSKPAKDNERPAVTRAEPPATATRN